MSGPSELLVIHSNRTYLYEWVSSNRILGVLVMTIIVCTMLKLAHCRCTFLYGAQSAPYILDGVLIMKIIVRTMLKLAHCRCTFYMGPKVLLTFWTVF